MLWRRTRPGRRPAAVLTALAALCALGGVAIPAGPAGAAAAYTVVAPQLAVPAVRDTLAPGGAPPVSHDNEVMALATQGRRLFAATDQWMYPGRGAAGQILVKNASSGTWRVFERTQVLRVQALDSFPVPADQGMGPGHRLLITQVIVHGRSEIQWLLDGATAFAPRDSFTLAAAAGVRAFGAHESDGVWSLYAGVAPTGILRGTWSRTRHTLVWSAVPELSAPAPGAPGVPAQKVTGFAECAGALYVSINTGLYRRNDGRLGAGFSRWVAVYKEPAVGAHNSGLRGLTCVTHDGAPSLLLSTEGNGDVFRLDHLPGGTLAARAVTPGRPWPGISSVLEFAPVPALRAMLASSGTPVPARGAGSIDYVIAAYNNFESIDVGGVTRQFFGIEHAYLGGCPPTRRCGPVSFGAATFDAAACFAVRTDTGGPSPPSYTLRCLSGPAFTPVARPGKPIRTGQSFVSIRSIASSPFGDHRIYYAGYDCNFYPADGTAWVGSSTVAAVSLGS
jgi:hypothetical protein